MGWPTSVGTSESHQLRPTRLKPTSGLRMLAPTSTRQGIDSMGLAEGLILPIALTTTLRLTPEEFAEVCEANPDAVLELAADGSLIPMTPTGSETGSRSGELFFQIKSWARANGGWMAFDSSTGFRLHDGSVRSPDAALVALERWRALSEEHHRGFAPLCPDLVVELASVRDASPGDAGPRELAALRRKMAACQANGARLGWLLIPSEQAVEVWLPWEGGEEPMRLEGATVLEGGELFAGLAINLAEIWAQAGESSQSPRVSHSVAGSRACSRVQGEAAGRLRRGRSVSRSTRSTPVSKPSAKASAALAARLGFCFNNRPIARRCSRMLQNQLRLRRPGCSSHFSRWPSSTPSRLTSSRYSWRPKASSSSSRPAQSRRLLS